MSRLPLILISVALVLALALGVFLWRAADELPSLGRVVGAGTASVGGPFALTDQDGKTRRSADFRGRYMLIYFGYTHCPDVCPTTLALMADALSKVGPKAARIVPIFITVDPERDTAGTLKGYLHAIAPQFTGLTGSVAAIKAVAAEYRVYIHKEPLPGGGYGMDHSSVIYLMGPDGRFVTYWDDTAIGPDKLAEELRQQI